MATSCSKFAERSTAALRMQQRQLLPEQASGWPAPVALTLIYGFFAERKATVGTEWSKNLTGQSTVGS